MEGGGHGENLILWKKDKTREQDALGAQRSNGTTGRRTKGKNLGIDAEKQLVEKHEVGQCKVRMTTTEQ